MSETRGSLVDWFRWLFTPAKMPKKFVGPYRVFTNTHDKIVTYATQEGLLYQVEPDVRFFPASPFDTYLCECIALYEKNASGVVASRPHNPVAVTLLLDHSGSLRGEPSQRLAATTGILAECLYRLRIPHEVLAFTTSSWRGGKSKRAWEQSGSPAAPGRLCDLLHIIYRAFDDPHELSYDALETMTKPWLLKENVDGEALLWASDRLKARTEARRVMIVISDGAPVDDTTLFANGPNILDDHLRLVIRELVTGGTIELYGLGIGFSMSRYYPQYGVLRDKEDIGKVALPLLQAILTSAAHKPSPEQKGD